MVCFCFRVLFIKRRWLAPLLRPSHPPIHPPPLLSYNTIAVAHPTPPLTLAPGSKTTRFHVCKDSPKIFHLSPPTLSPNTLPSPALVHIPARAHHPYLHQPRLAYDDEAATRGVLLWDVCGLIGWTDECVSVGGGWDKQQQCPTVGRLIKHPCRERDRPDAVTHPNTHNETRAALTTWAGSGASCRRP